MTTNKLCDTGCLGFPTKASSAYPKVDVFCKDGNLMVPVPKAQLLSRQGQSESFAVTLSSAQTIPGAYMQPTFTNPFEDQANVLVHHEFGIAIGVATADTYEVYGDLNVTGSGAQMYTGATTASFLLERNDGSGETNDNRIAALYHSYGFTMWYTVPAGGSFAIGMQVRLEAITIRAGLRSMTAAQTAMTVAIQPRYV